MYVLPWVDTNNILSIYFMVDLGSYLDRDNNLARVWITLATLCTLSSAPLKNDTIYLSLDCWLFYISN